MRRIAAVILTGGKGERLGGVNKALVEIGRIRLIDRVFPATVGCDPVLLSTGSTAFATALPVPSDRHIADLDTAYGGPLAGVAAAIEWLSTRQPPELLFTLAVDTPFFPADFVPRALALIEGSPAVVAAYGAQDYPTNALWRFDRLTGLPAGLRDSTAPHSLKRLAAGLGGVRLDYCGLAPEDPFVNVNTPADAALLEGRAKR